jgi:hypothetical protein
MSNRDRIARMAAEKAAEKKEKEAAKKTRSATSKKTATKKTATKKTATKKTATKASSAKAAAAKPAGGLKLVWAVCDNTGATVKTYPYPERKNADAEAARLTTSKGKTHFVKNDKVPME